MKKSDIDCCSLPLSPFLHLRKGEQTPPLAFARDKGSLVRCSPYTRRRRRRMRATDSYDFPLQEREREKKSLGHTPVSSMSAQVATFINAAPNNALSLFLSRPHVRAPTKKKFYGRSISPRELTPRRRVRISISFAERRRRCVLAFSRALRQLNIYDSRVRVAHATGRNCLLGFGFSDFSGLLFWRGFRAGRTRRVCCFWNGNDSSGEARVEVVL